MITRRKLLQTGGLAGLGLGAAGLGYSLGSRYRETRELLELVNLMGSPAIASEPPSTGLSKDTIYGLACMAAIRAVAWAEGTYIPGRVKEYDPYRVMVGSTLDRPRLAPNFDDHPRDSIFFNSRDRSDAAGACQFISSTWDGTRRRYPDIWIKELPAFAPQNQDRAFLALAGDTGGLRRLLDGVVVLHQRINVDSRNLEAAFYRFSAEWASIPGHNIGAATGQSTKAMPFILSNYYWFLRESQPAFRHSPPVFPVGGDQYHFANTRVSDTYRARSATRWHWGTDLAIPTGTPLVAVEDGTIGFAGWDSGGGGNIVRLEGSTWAGDQYYYMHLDSFESGIQAGATVKKGDIIGRSGNTGASTGPHLHFEWRVLGGFRADPYRLMGAHYWYGANA